MRTSLNEIQEIERYILGAMGEVEAVAFQEQLRRNPVQRLNLMVQLKVMTVIKMYHRKRLKTQLEEVHERMMNDPLKASWRERLVSLFLK